jgi:hypothetical protein
VILESPKCGPCSREFERVERDEDTPGLRRPHHLREPSTETSTYIVELQRSFARAHRCLVSEFTMNNAKRKDALVINTDGSSFHNGKADAIAGIGVYFGPHDNR